MGLVGLGRQGTRSFPVSCSPTRRTPMNKAMQPNIARLGMSRPTPCHSEAPVFWGRRIPVVALNDQSVSRRMEVSYELRRSFVVPKSGPPQDDMPGGVRRLCATQTSEFDLKLESHGGQGEHRFGCGQQARCTCCTHRAFVVALGTLGPGEGLLLFAGSKGFD